MADPAENKGEVPSANQTGDRQAIRQRLNELGRKLKGAQERQSGDEDDDRRSSAIGTAYRLTVELVVGLVVGGFLGWWVDYLLGTTPLFLLIFFFLGMAAGILNVMKAAKQMQKHQEQAAGNDAGAVRRDDD